jgi:uncharacterized protein YneF (UPF0154 family)
MNGLQIILMVVAVNAGVLGVAFFAVYQFNKAVSQSGR